jgi:hypothetical protein
MFYKVHRFFTEDINLIQPYFKDFSRANLWALAAPIAFVRIDGDIPVTRPKISAIRIIDHSWPRSFENNYR